MDVEARLVTPNVEDSIWVWTIDLYTDTAAAADDDDYDDDERNASWARSRSLASIGMWNIHS